MAEEIIIRSKLDVSDSEKSLNRLDNAVDKTAQRINVSGAGMNKTMKSVRTSAMGLVGAYTAVSSATMLLNGSSEKTAETLTKLMAIQNIAMGLQKTVNALTVENNVIQIARNGITATATALQKVYTTVVGTTTGAMKALRVAMLALPLLAVIAGVTALVGWLSKLGNSTKELEEANEKLNDSYDKQIELMQFLGGEREKDLKRQLEIAELSGASDEELHSRRIGLINAREKARKKELDLEIETLHEIEKQWTESLRKRDKDLQESLKKQMDMHSDRVDELIAQEDNYTHSLEVERLKFDNKQKERDEKEKNEALKRQKEYNEKRLKEQEEARQKEFELDRLFEDLLISNITDDNARREAEIRTRFEREKQHIIDNYGEQTEVIKQLEIQRDAEINELRKELQEEEDKEFEELEERDRQAKHEREKLELEQRLNSIRDDFEAEQAVRQELAELERDFQLKNDELTAEERLLIQDRYNSELLKMSEQRAKNEESIEQAKANAIRNVQNALFGAVLDNLEEGTTAYKAIAITQTTITTIQSAIEAFKSMAGIPIVGPALGAAAAAAATTSGIAAIRKISQTEVNASGGGGASMPSAPTFDTGAMTAGSVQSGVFDDSDVLKSSTTDNAGESQQVVILQSEIEASQKTSKKTKMISKG